MPGKISSHTLASYCGVTLDQVVTAAGETDWVKLSGKVALQITGPATAISVQVERSTRDPAGGQPNTAPAGELITGNPAVGLQPRAYEEPGVAWWRARCVSLTGASAVIAINGVGA